MAFFSFFYSYLLHRFIVDQFSTLFFRSSQFLCPLLVRDELLTKIICPCGGKFSPPEQAHQESSCHQRKSKRKSEQFPPLVKVAEKYGPSVISISVPPPQPPLFISLIRGRLATKRLCSPPAKQCSLTDQVEQESLCRLGKSNGKT